MDDYLRRLERQAAAGDYMSRKRWIAALVRAGFPDPNHEALHAPLTEWEETQKHYDDLWWHGSTPHKCGLWNHSCFRHRDEDFKPSVFKAHHDWGHRWGGENSKRKTLRTHRSSKKKARSHRLRAENHKAVEQTETARRRKKRFGGKQHRSYKWVWNPETERMRILWKITEPNLDE